MRRFLFLSCLLATVVTVADVLLLLGNFGNPCP